MENNNTTTNEIMEFLQENIATKEDLKDLKEELKKEMVKQKADIIDSVDKKLGELKW